MLSRSELQGIREKDEEVILPPKDCDLFTGQWVFDDVTHPLYIEEKCENLLVWSMFSKVCFRGSRFKAKLLLEKLRGKRLMSSEIH